MKANIVISKQKVRTEHKRDRSADGKTFHLNAVIQQDFHKDFNPFVIGPVEVRPGIYSLNMENAWQYSKVYESHVDNNGNPTMDWRIWSMTGFGKQRADRYPMGKGKKPLYSWFDGEKLDYIDARKRIYWPLYQQAVLMRQPSWDRLVNLCDTVDEIVIWDYDGYPMNGLTFTDIINDTSRPMGHAFVLAAMLLHGPKITPEELIKQGK